MENFRLKVFRSVCEQLSFRRAAEELHLSQPAITQQVKALEDELGTRLFDRTGGRVVLTPAGRILKKRAAELAELALPLRAHVNLIPLNPTPGYAGRGTPAAGAAWFGAELAARGVKATVRANRGTDIDAACGQLAAGQVPAAARPRRAPAAAGAVGVAH